MNDPIRRPMPRGVSFEVTDHNQAAPTRIVIAVRRENFGRIGFCVAAVIDKSVLREVLLNGA